MESYENALTFLFNQLPMFSRIGAPAYKPGLETSLQLDEFFGHPHTHFKSIHIGGTNGKGSTSHMLASVLQCSGYKTGLYTSPHLTDFRERIRIDGEMISKEEVISFVDNWKKTDYSGHPSFFELTMMLAFDCFAKRNIDVAVIEVGMGGRLDSTNIITPEMSVITNISKDHTQFLGETLEKIAGEKAGIIKTSIPVVIGESSGEGIRKVFIDKAKEMNSEIVFAEGMSEDYSFEKKDGGWKVIHGKNEYFIPLPGDYQKKNIVTVLESIKILKKQGFHIPDAAIYEGLKNVNELTGLRGRWSVLSEKPLVICDTGHNIAGMTYNMQQLNELVGLTPKRNLHIVIGFVADKDIENIIDLLPSDAYYYVTNAQIPRALNYLELKKKFDKRGFKNLAFPTVKEAFDAAKNNAKSDDVVFIGGSTFIVADLLALKL